jgi:hypothetical protein
VIGTEAYPALEGQPGSRAGRLGRAVLGAILMAVTVTGISLRKTARPAVGHLAAHGYSLIGLGFISAAAYTHSLFAGLLVSGIAFILFEWKASPDA